MPLFRSFVAEWSYVDWQSGKGSVSATLATRFRHLYWRDHWVFGCRTQLPLVNPQLPAESVSATQIGRDFPWALKERPRFWLRNPIIFGMYGKFLFPTALLRWLRLRWFPPGHFLAFVSHWNSKYLIDNCEIFCRFFSCLNDYNFSLANNAFRDWFTVRPNVSTTIYRRLNSTDNLIHRFDSDWNRRRPGRYLRFTWHRIWLPPPCRIAIEFRAMPTKSYHQKTTKKSSNMIQINQIGGESLERLWLANSLLWMRSFLKKKERENWGKINIGCIESQIEWKRI